MEPLKLVVVSAGPSRPSSTRLLADRLTEATRLRAETFELREPAQEISSHLVSGFPPPALEETIERVTGADALIAVTPSSRPRTADYSSPPRRTGAAPGIR